MHLVKEAGKLFGGPGHSILGQVTANFHRTPRRFPQHGKPLAANVDDLARVNVTQLKEEFVWVDKFQIHLGKFLRRKMLNVEREDLSGAGRNCGLNDVEVVRIRQLELRWQRGRNLNEAFFRVRPDELDHPRRGCFTRPTVFHQIETNLFEDSLRETSGVQSGKANRNRRSRRVWG